MKKLIALTIALVMTFAFGYATMASTIGIGAGEGFSAEIGKVVSPSGIDNIELTGRYGVNEQLLLSLGYGTDTKDTSLGVRYAFNKNMAVTLDYLMPNEDVLDDLATLGFRYKAEINDQLALVGVLSYTNTDPDATTGITGQAEFKFSDKTVGNLGFEHTKMGDVDGTNIIAGVEIYPVEQLSVYVDYTMMDSDSLADDTVEIGASYAF